MNKLLLAVAFLLLMLATQNTFSQGSVAMDSVTVADSVLVINDLGTQEEALIDDVLASKSNILDMDRTKGFSLMTILRGLLGMFSLVVIAFIFSTNRKAINWKVIGLGLSMQLILAIGVLYVPWIQYFFEAVGQLFVLVLDFTKAGTEFLFSSFVTNNIESALQNFVVQILPTIIFFSALTSLLFYLGVIQRIVKALAWVMTRLLNLSGAESLSVAGNIFLGQTESPLMIKAYLPKMNKSEILLVMMGGMATLAGGVLAVYISFLGGDDPVQRLLFAKHLLTASVMAAPGAIVISKILMPQTEDIDKTMHINKEQIGSNVLDAISNGTTEGLKLAANVAAMLLVFIAFIAMFNYISIWFGDLFKLNSTIAEISSGRYNELSLQFMLGYIFSPVMWLIGVHSADITLLGRLLGEKIIMTEFIGYVSLSELKAASMFTDPKSIIMATYMLCGFANFASIGIQIGGIGSLAPNQRVTLSKFGLRALLGGTLASLMSATIVGMLF
ncbi:MAG: Na+ dependent nucleoside transporter [Bacteroidetes bacterium]|nr:Na+ dependent nucleoside transporter [Bacteroidota bacterium]MBU1578240.1 Na+ dependent nucleoside transporter [Bacteroidota bacterium]MBU2464948.1 Na+ dependent nucleoside transporter [Bacteroidota bacterium]MBU2556416.1 Na+ dependent nucleoside transporter [Bacteroidota bacterium]